MTIASYPSRESQAKQRLRSGAVTAQIIASFGFMIAIPALAIAGNQAGVLQIVFPVLSVAVGSFLLWRSRPAYVELVFWLWFLSPFLGRMAGFQSGWTPNNGVEVAPYLTAGLTAFPVFASLRSFGDRRLLPYACALIAIAYGLILGLIKIPIFNVMRALLNWLVPVLFGAFIYLSRDEYHEIKKVIERSFLLGTLVTGAYGIYQFFWLPDWDKMWMLNVQLNSFGAVEATKIRAFSTMNAPAIFAAMATAGLLLLFNSPNKLRFVSAGCGFIGLMLTMSRASWLSLLAGGAYLLLRSEMRQRMHLTLAIFSCCIAFMSVSQVPAVHDLLIRRIETFSDPSQDVSFSARIAGHREAFRQIAQEPFGEGIGSTDTYHNTEGDDDIIGPHDSTVLEFLYSVGWIGSLVYLIGFIQLIARLLRSGRQDAFVVSAKAILIGLCIQSLLNSVMIGVLGFLVWTLASMCLIASEEAVTGGKREALGRQRRIDVIAA